MAQLVNMMNRYILHSNRCLFSNDDAEHLILLKLRALLNDENGWRNNSELDVNRPHTNTQNGSYDYALWCAIKMKNPLDVCQFLLDKGASVHLPVPDSQFLTEILPTTLHRICSRGSLDLMEIIYHHVGDKEEFLKLMSVRNYAGQSPCWFAVSHGSPELVEWLIQIGCDFGETDASGRTNFINAIKSGNNRVVLMLIQLPCCQKYMEFGNYYQHPLTMAVYLSRYQVLSLLWIHLLGEGKIRQWEVELLSYCIGDSDKQFESDFFENLKDDGLLPFEITVPIIFMCGQPDIIENYFRKFIVKQSPEFIADLLNKKYISGESLLHLTYVCGMPMFSNMPRFLHFLLKHGANPQEIRIFTNQLVNRDFDSAAVLLSGGLQLHGQKPQTYEREHSGRFVEEYYSQTYEKHLNFDNWNKLFDYAAVDDLFLYILWASGHEAMVRDYLRTKEKDVVDSSPGPWVDRKSSPLVNEMGGCLTLLGARDWFSRGRPSLVRAIPSLSLMCIQQVRKTLSSKICSKVADLNLPQSLTADLLLGIDSYSEHFISL